MTSFIPWTPRNFRITIWEELVSQVYKTNQISVPIVRRAKWFREKMTTKIVGIICIPATEQLLQEDELISLTLKMAIPLPCLYSGMST